MPSTRSLEEADENFPIVESQIYRTKSREPSYYWRIAPVANTAELLTLFCQSCKVEAAGYQDVPLVAVLRDTLGDSNPRNDRISYVWLLTCSRPSIGSRFLSAIPFFYWRLGESSGKIARDMATRIDLSPALKATARGLMGGRSSFVLAKGLVQHNVEKVRNSSSALTGDAEQISSRTAD